MMHEPECPYEIGGDECHCFSIQTAIDNERERIAQAIEAKKFLSWSANARIARNGGSDDT